MSNQANNGRGNDQCFWCGLWISVERQQGWNCYICDQPFCEDHTRIVYNDPRAPERWEVICIRPECQPNNAA